MPGGERQTRRHLTIGEAELALGRGKGLEIFMGRCGDTKRPGIRFATLHRSERWIQLSAYEMLDDGNKEFLDLYETRPLNESGGADGCVLEAKMESVTDCLAHLEQRFPGRTYSIVNFGVLGDEYLDFLRQRNADSPNA